jgi:hypothetical protein
MTTGVLVVLVGLGVVLIVAGLLLSGRQSSMRQAPESPSSGAAPAAGEELQATPISEAVEDLVNQRLATIPDLAHTRLDFGSAADGSLEIWIGDSRYTSIEAIPDPRIRQAVREAVDAYNKPGRS